MTGRVEALARSAFEADGLNPTSWSNGPGTEYAAHEHPRHKVLYCIEGSIAFRTSDGDISMKPGDRLDLPAGTIHTATVGPDGVTCWEAYR